VSAPGRYCAPKRCYCGDPSCPAYPSYNRPLGPIMETIVDARAVASGKRRSSTTGYRNAQIATGKRERGPGR
jgi:hypothetical protein